MTTKGLVFDIQRASMHDGPGIRTTVFLKGCSLHCLWCHNPEAVSFERQLFFYYDKCKGDRACALVCELGLHYFEDEAHRIDFKACDLCGKCIEACNHEALKISGVEMSVEQVMVEVLADRPFYLNSGGGLTLSGGEPLAQFEFSLEVLKQSKAEGVHTCVETSGFAPRKKIEQILPLVDLFLFDYKLTDSAQHQQYTGVPNELILSNLEVIYHSGSEIILRCPIIPGINDTEEHFNGIRLLEGKYPRLACIDILPYHDLGNSKRTSLGLERTLPGLKSASPETAGVWLQQLEDLGCEKVRLG